MPQDIRAPRDSGRIRLPSVDGAMNKIAPPAPKTDDKGTMLGAPKGEAQRKKNLLARIRKRMERAISAESDNRKAALDDLKFEAGDQWPSEVIAQRNLDKRPCLTINKLPVFVHQVTNDLRQNRPSINVSPVGDRGDPDVAKMYRGLIRFIERDCAADIAYDTGAASAVKMGWGYWRIVTEWESPDSFNLNLVIRRVRNPFTVYLDPAAQDPTGADAKWGIVTEMVPRDEFEEKWPDADPMPYVDGGIGETQKNWIAKDEVRVAEYFEIEYKTRTLVELDNGHQGWEDELDDVTLGYIRRGKISVTDEREARVPEVMWYKVTAVDILMEREWLGSTVPIVKVVGDEMDIEGKPKYSGVIRFAKDPQRMYNYWTPLSLDTPLPTPTGWTTMGDVRPGDYLLDDQGKPTKVVGESPVHLFRDCYRVGFDDGSHIVADAGHPWAVEEKGRRTKAGRQWTDKIVGTSELTPGRHFINVCKPLDLPDIELPVEPYLLGVWLGDGNAASPVVCGSDHEIDEIRANLEEAGCRLSPVRRQPNRVGVFTVYGVSKTFRETGLIGRKHVPEIYLRASERQRWALLQGLMDTDGSITPAKQCSFTTVLPALAESYAELLRSLGIKAVFCMKAERRTVMPGGHVSNCRAAYQFSFSAPPGTPVFRLRHKAGQQDAPRPFHARRTKRHRIVSVDAVPSVPVKCVGIESPSHLFLAGRGMVPTHNTSATELIALAPKAPWIVEEGQIEGHEDEWKTANVRSQPYLSYKGTSIGGTQAPPPQRQQFAGVPAGVESARQGAAMDMMATTGIRFDATMNERMTDESGRAIRELRRSGDIGNFHFVDNFARSLRRTGEILIELIPKVYSEPRTVTILREDDKEEQVRIDPTIQKAVQDMKRADGKTVKAFNPMRGKYGVTVTIGPSYATKRIEASENMMQFARALPNTAALISDLIAKNQDWPGADEIAARLAKTIPPNLLSPDHKDMTPQVQALIGSMDAQIKDLGQKLQAAMAALSDKNADRAIEADKIGKDFEAKLLKIVSDMETKAAAIQERADANYNTHIGAQIRELGEGVTELMHGLDGAAQQPPPGRQQGIPEAAARTLRPGRVTTFGNGQKWTLRDGKPAQVG